MREEGEWIQSLFPFTVRTCRVSASASFISGASSDVNKFAGCVLGQE